ncbi:preprotein translocase subunit, ATPase [Candidatus Desulfarcum epimagneticum]|uniref:Protein translocase subunit SecA n=1 Tax=uncultured Desulfobacteraceae bacterium TaxID=218296 RepID=A0A484HGX5_9BACT|nr:preprotein translocase subunit, ATPase [uncultured Desulfobacteraceae bacterium]
MASFLTKLFGSKNERELKRLRPLIEKINSLEPKARELSDEGLRAQTALFRDRLEKGEPLDALLPEAFATVREASVRSLGMRHFDVQLLGGIALHEGKIAEMKTGEGKTLAATLPAYLNSLGGKGVHVITVNDYLAARDTEWMGKLYHFLGLSVGAILHGLDDLQRKKAYSSDIAYGTNNEFGFDYLRDNMKFEKDEIVQGDLNFAIVDEVDSILVDEARTPLIISGPAEKSTDLYYQVNHIIPFLKKDLDFKVDEKAKSATLTEDGVAAVEKTLKTENLFDPKNIEILHHVNQGLKAHSLFKRDVDYIVKEGEVIIVDEFTGRLMPGRRYSEGLHQALEAKEGVKIENENQTLATVTFQNYFRMYDKLSGMTGTADTEAAEFKKIYGLDVLVIPTNQPMVRKDFPDMIYKTKREKYDAVIQEIADLNQNGQPVLVGTISIDVSEDLSRKLKKKGISHSVLNAKNHEREAEIIAMAGQKHSVTISTNMAGRGTDIVLGEGVTELGGLRIIGTERHESRRIDNQLRGRSGRQGDPGSSRFYMALEDDLLRIFGGERISGVMEKLGIEEGEPIEHKLITRAIENAQARVEGHNFDIRKQLLEYDDVMNQQREVIYRLRRRSMDGDNIRQSIEETLYEKAADIAHSFSDERTEPDAWDMKGVREAVFGHWGMRLDTDAFLGSENTDKTREGLADFIEKSCAKIYSEKEAIMGRDHFGFLERIVALQTLDKFWKDHLLSMDHLKEGIGLRGYAQQNPLLIYKKEGYDMFSDMIARAWEEIVAILFRIQIEEPEKIEEITDRGERDLVFSGSPGDGAPPRGKPVKRAGEKIGRNAPCPCGSGKKYKKCCGR